MFPPASTASCTAPSATADDPLARAASAYASSLWQTHQIAGVLQVERGGSILLEQAFGMASLETGTPLAVDAQFRIGSVTKLWTRKLVLDAVNAGKLRLDSRLGEWLPQVPHWQAVTVLQLLEHRSGLPRAASATYEPTSPEQAVAQCAQLPTSFAPGAEEQYSNCGYDVLARVLELAEQAPFAELLRRQLLAPLGMQDSGIGAAPARLAVGYTRKAGAVAVAEPSRYQAGGSGGYATARDLCRFIQAVRGKTLQRSGPPAWSGDPVLPLPVSSPHAGRTKGYVSYLVMDAEHATSVVYLTNQDEAPLAQVYEDLKRLARGEVVQAPRARLRRVIDGDPALSPWLVGSYRLERDPTQVLRVEQSGRQLLLIDPDGETSWLVFVGPRQLALVPPHSTAPEVSSDAELSFPELQGPAPFVELQILGGVRLKAQRVAPR